MSDLKTAIKRQTERRNRGFSLHQGGEVQKQWMMHSAQVLQPLEVLSRRLRGYPN